MKAIQRHPIAGVGLVAVTMVVRSASAHAQCAPLRPHELEPAPKYTAAPKVLIPTIHNDPKLGDGKMAEEFSRDLRDRIKVISDEKNLWVIPCVTVNKALVQSGYKADSALSPSDFKLLGQAALANESIDGVIRKTPDGQYHVRIKVFYLNNPNWFEPLPEVSGKDIDGLAQDVAAKYMDVRKEFDSYYKCRNLYRDAKLDEALKAEATAHSAYPGGILPIECRLDVLIAMKNPPAPPDSILSTAAVVLGVDSMNRAAIGDMADAYRDKGDTAKAVAMYIHYYDMNRRDTAGARTVIQILAQSGAPDKAVPIIDTLLQQNPANAEMLDIKLKLLLRLHKYKEAYAAFDELEKLDSARVNLDYFRQMVVQARADSNQQMVLQYLARALRRYERADATLWMAYSVELHKTGQLQQALDAAKRAVALDPKTPPGYPWIFQLYRELGQTDSTLAYVKVAMAAGVDKDLVNTALLGVLSPAVQKAQASNTADDWKALMALSERLDSISPSPSTKYHTGLAAAEIGLLAYKAFTELEKTDKPAACVQIGVFEGMFATAQIKILTEGGSAYNREGAGSIMNPVTQITPLIPEWKKAMCK